MLAENTRDKYRKNRIVLKQIRNRVCRFRGSQASFPRCKIDCIIHLDFFRYK